MTTVEDLLAPGAVDPAAPVVKNGRYQHLDPVTGEKRTSQRASNFARYVGDTYRLQLWEKRMVLLGAAMRPDLSARAVAAGADDRKTLDMLAAEAKEAAGGSKGANLGTAMHNLTDRADRGEKVELPPPLDADLAAYRKALADHGVAIVPDLIERVVYCAELGVAGRFDRIVAFDDRHLVGDLKTGGHLDMGEISIQLALYARAEWMWLPGTGWVPKPDVDLAEALVFHLPAGKATCTIHAVDIAVGWEGVAECARVRDWRRRKGLSRQLLPAGDDDLVAQLEASLTNANGSSAPTPSRCDEGPAAGSAEGHTGAPANPMAKLDAFVAGGATAPAPDATENPEFIATHSAALRERLGRSIVQLPDRVLPPGMAWPADVPTFKQGGPTSWAQVQLVERFVLDVEREVRAPFEDSLPDDPLEGLAPDPVRLARLELLYGTLPTDLQLAAGFAAKEAGLPDSRRCAGDDLDRLAEIIGAAAHDHELRKAWVASRMAEYSDDELVASFVATATDGRRRLTELRADDVDRLDALVDAIDTLTLAFTYGDAGPVIGVTERTEPALLERHRSKKNVLEAARPLAAALERPKPTSTAQVAADPVLAALLTRCPAPGEVVARTG